MIFRRYTPADRSTCIAILDSNMPRFFSHQDRTEFLAFLDAPVGIYNVLEEPDGHIIGCGGAATRDQEHIGVLTWGMIHARYHRQGWGRLLAFLRLRQLTSYPTIQKIILNTSQETVGFYEKLGFHTTDFVANFYGEGLHCFKMEQQIGGEFQQRLKALEMQLGYST
jgi:ribosomal protein S18 acetylase RimI-like enzyme